MKESLLVDSPETQKYLLNPLMVNDGKKFLVMPESVLDQQVTFTIEEVFSNTQPPLFKRWFLSLRAISLTVMLIPCIATFIMGTMTEWRFSVYDAVVALIIPSLLLLAVNVTNDVQDHLRLIDLPGTNGGSGVIQKGWITPQALTNFAKALVVLSAILALPLLIKKPLVLISLTLFTLIAVVGYSGRPFNFKYRAMGDLIVFLMCGPFLSLSYSLAVFGKTNLSINLMGSFFGFLACAILHANNLNDITTDQKRGAITIANLLGFESSKKYLYALYLLSLVTLLAFMVKAELSLLSLSPLLLALFPLARLFRKIARAQSPDDKTIADIRFITPQIHLILGILLCGILLVLKNSST
jgi:1,4-dihydroxy-2-naphthoate octaprenyltransferase